jgi:hypothetical protein
MRQSIAILSMLASAAMAADVVSFYFPGGRSLTLSTLLTPSLTLPDSEGVDPVATIKKVDASTTEMNLACPTDVDSTNCGWGPGLDYTIISNTHYQAQMSYDSVAMSFACDHNTQASEMTCTVSMQGGNTDTDIPATAVLKGSQISFNKATVVQGASLLTQATPAAAAAGTTGPGALITSTAVPAQHTGSAASVGVQVSALFVVAGAVVMSVL